jgi:hypothetical protein
VSSRSRSAGGVSVRFLLVLLLADLVDVSRSSHLYGRWHSIYPIYFDAKASTTTGRRVTRQKSLWWPQSFQIAKACSSLGLETVHEVSSILSIELDGLGQEQQR